jgi:phosphoglycolate phosphatase
MPIRGILFDKDGTLIDVNGTWVPVYRQMLCEQFAIGVDAANAMMRLVGYDPSTDRFAANSVLASGTTRQLIEVWWPGLTEAETLGKIRMLDVGYAPLARSVLKPLMPLAPLLNDLKSMGFHVGVATNDSHCSACNHMSHLGVFDLFDEVIGADSVAAPKPSGDMIRKFAATTGLDLAEIAMVGDNSHDIDEARNGGAGLAIAVLSGNASREDIAHLADHTLDSISTLPELLRSLADVL